jgi:hypothetical protein
VGRFRAHETGPSGGFARSAGQDGQKNGVFRGLLLLDGLVEGGFGRVRAVKEPGPEVIVLLDGLPKGGSMLLGVQRLERDIASAKGDMAGGGNWLPFEMGWAGSGHRMSL